MENPTFCKLVFCEVASESSGTLVKMQVLGLLPFVTIWMDLDGIMLSAISQAETVKYHVISLICGI